jgi:DNA-binding NarL/FixJ family response regulator
MRRIHVLIVEDDAIWRRCITEYIEREDDITVLCSVTNKEEAISIAKANQLDVILMDINLTENKLDGIEAASELIFHTDAKIIMLTALSEEDLILNAFSAGAVNYVSKSDYRRLPAIIRSTVFNCKPVSVLLNDYLRLKEEETLHVLTNAEREVFDLIRQGFTQSQIEQKLFKSESTVKKQVNHILKKLKVRSSREAVEKLQRRDRVNQNKVL